MLEVINPVDEQNNFTNPKEIVSSVADMYRPTIFLAGPCPRTDYSDDWRFEAIKYLEEAGFDGIVFNPTNSKYDVNDKDYLTKQTGWECDAMFSSDKVVFWIPRDEEHPAFTTNIELGQFLNYDDIDKIVIGMPDKAIKNEYIKVRLKLLGKEYYKDLKELMNAVVEETKYNFVGA